MISIIIATKNGGKWLNRSLASIEAQTEKDIEVIIVSDGSTDDTAQIVRDLSQTRPYLRLIELTENVGPGKARDLGIKEAKGDYIALIDDDDEWISPYKLATQEEFLTSHSEYVLVGASQTDFVKEDGTFISKYRPYTTDEDIRNHLLLTNQFITSSMMFKKAAYLQVGGFAAMYLAEDYDLWLRLMKIGKACNLEKCDTRYYTRATGAHRSNNAKMNRVISELVKKYKDAYPHYRLALIKNYLRILFNTMH